MTQSALAQHGGGAAAAAALVAVARVGEQQKLSAAMVNSFRVASVMERLVAMLKPGNTVDLADFSTLCLSLSRGIDYAVANHEQPSTAHNLPALVKQICEQKSDPTFQAFIMVLLISIKNACKVGWFPAKETEELLTLSNELARMFCSPIEISPAASYHSMVGTVMERFYPRMKIGHILSTFEVQPGYGVYTNDFHILKKTPCSPEDKIRLLVIHADNLDTSACIISPQQANFVINGRGVEKRNNTSMDTGPQMPSNVTPLLKYGTNLIQAVGQFNGNYLVVIAFMSEMPSCNNPILQDHVQPIVDGSDSDPELIEGPSRISLNCPISFSRIKLPVKGHSCKHLQCFDFSNFVDINSRRPSWRCPHCNQSICYLDIRVDQNMVKVLKEVGDDVADVIISADGSWKAVFENDDHLDQARDTNLNPLKETSEPLESTAVQNALPSVIDLAEDDGTMDIDNICGIEDIKPSLADLSATPQLNNTIGINQNVGAPMDEACWQGLHIASGLAANAWLDNPVIGGIPHPTPTTLVQSASVAPVLNREADGRVNTNLTVPEMQSHLSSPNNFQSQQMQFMNSIPSNEYGSFPSISRTVSRTPVAVQALPAQSQTPGAQRLRPSVNSSTPNSSNIASQAGSSPTGNGLNTMYEDLPRFNTQPQAPTVAPPTSSRPLLLAQNRPDRPLASQVHNAYWSSSLAEFQNSHLRQIFNSRVSQSMGQSLNAVQLPLPLLRTPVQQGSAQASSGPGSQHIRISSTVQRPPHMSRQHPVGPVQTQSPRHGPSLPTVAVRPSTGVVQADPGANGQVDLTPEQNWRPAGRMRGSLSGRDLSHFSDIMIQPTQSAQPARSPLPSVPVSPAPAILPELQALRANNRTALSSQPQNNATR